MRHSELVQRLAGLEPIRAPIARLEQLATSPERAAELLESALARDDIVGRRVVDLGTGNGILAIAAGLLGAAELEAVEIDPGAADVARRNFVASDVPVQIFRTDVRDYSGGADTVVMNPPFGAQTRHADRAFWETAFRVAERAVYAFSLADSRSFIARSAVARQLQIEETRAVDWDLERTFPHHARKRVRIPVDRWVLRRAPSDERTDRSPHRSPR
ncbi:MAG: methyltransferase [Thermoplasmata archaeon]